MKANILLCLFALLFVTAFATEPDQSTDLLQDEIEKAFLAQLDIKLYSDHMNNLEGIDEDSLEAAKLKFAKMQDAERKDLIRQILNEKIQVLQAYFANVPVNQLIQIAMNALVFKNLIAHLSGLELNAQDTKQIISCVQTEELDSAIDDLAARAALVEKLSEDAVDKLLTGKGLLAPEGDLLQKKILILKNLSASEISPPIDPALQGNPPGPASSNYKLSSWILISLAVVALIAVVAGAHFAIKKVLAQGAGESDDLEEVEV
jgi:hypothetical protein